MLLHNLVQMLFRESSATNFTNKDFECRLKPSIFAIVAILSLSVIQCTVKAQKSFLTNLYKKTKIVIEWDIDSRYLAGCFAGKWVWISKRIIHVSCFWKFWPTKLTVRGTNSNFVIQSLSTIKKLLIDTLRGEFSRILRQKMTRKDKKKWKPMFFDAEYRN